MTIEQFYAVTGGNYSEVLGRIGKEERVKKYLLRFPDTDELIQMNECISAENWPEAFRHIHSLKGMALTLGLSRLAGSGSELCETMRHGAPEVDISDMIRTVQKDFDDTVEAISMLD